MKNLLWGKYGYFLELHIGVNTTCKASFILDMKNELHFSSAAHIPQCDSDLLAMADVPRVC